MKRFLNDRELKYKAQESLLRFNGYAPIIKNIRLLEASGDGVYIRFMVGSVQYVLEGGSLERRRRYDDYD